VVCSFDTIPHDELMQSLARRIVDPDMLRLIKQWLRAPVETTDGDGRKRMAGGKASRRGVPQGGVISPLIANLYMNRFLKYWRQTGRGEAWKAHVINYADDCVPRRRRRKRRRGTAREMRVGPSEPAVRGRLQTTASCGGKELLW
jgi:retron-type reverse transcriptase